MNINWKKVQEGIQRNLIKIINCPNCNEIACQIGEHWFYFCDPLDYEAKNMSAAMYIQAFEEEYIAQTIASALKDLCRDSNDEFLYYRAVLTENGIQICDEASPNSVPKYQALLYYGIEESESDCSIYHSFRAEDPALLHDDDSIAKELAEQLDCEADDDNFQCRSMYIDLPESLVQRIRNEAVSECLSDATQFIQKNKAFAEQVFNLMRMQRLKEDVRTQIAGRGDIDAFSELTEADIYSIAISADCGLSKNEIHSEAYWETIDQAIDEFVDPCDTQAEEIEED